MNTWKVKKGTRVLLQGSGEYELKRDISLYVEVCSPLQQFPNEIVAARSLLLRSDFSRSPTRFFLLREEYPKHPSALIGVHEKDLVYTMNVFKCRKCNTILRVDGQGQLKLTCPRCGAVYEILYEGDASCSSSSRAQISLEKQRSLNE